MAGSKLIYGQTVKLDNHITGWNRAATTIDSIRMNIPGTKYSQVVGWHFTCSCGAKRAFTGLNSLDYYYAAGLHFRDNHRCPR